MNSFQSISLTKDLHSESDNNDVRYSKGRTIFSFGSPLCCCFYCFILGSLVTGVILAITMTMWLKPVTTTATTTIINQIDISSTSNSMNTTTVTTSKSTMIE